MTLALAFIHPDQAGNLGTSIRTAACFGVALHLVEPAGFPFSHAALRRAGMDYAEIAAVRRHADWSAFVAATAEAGRRVLLTTAPDATALPTFAFAPDDCLMLGSESVGAPPHVHAAADARVRIPMHPGMRSLNVAVAAGIALGEALRQTGGFSA